MANEISVNAVIIEREDGVYRAYCPDLGIDAQGKSADDALANLKDAVIRHVRGKGASGIRLSAVKCLKIKIPVNG